MHTQIWIILRGIKFYMSCLLLKLWKCGDFKTKYARFIIFSVSELPQYIVAPHTGGEIGDNLNPGFIYCFLSSDYGRALIQKFTYGSVVDEIDENHLSSVPFLRKQNDYEPHLPAQLIWSLVDSGCSATLKQFASHFVLQDESQFLYYEDRITSHQ